MKNRRDNNNDYERKPEYWESMTKSGRRLFTVSPLIAPLIIILITLGIYYYLILINNYFPSWQTYIYWAVKLIIAFEILAASARTLLGPILALLIGGLLLVLETLYDLAWFAAPDAWQIIFVAVIGFVVTFIVKM